MARNQVMAASLDAATTQAAASSAAAGPVNPTSSPAILRRRSVLRGGVGALALGGALTLLNAAPSLAAYPTVQLGDKGDHISALQSFLGAKGYWCGTPDGDFGHLTQQAIWALQKQGGLTPDGIVGRKTLLALSRDALPTPESSSSAGLHVEVDRTTQLLLLVKDGSTHLVLNTSTGNGQPYDWYGRQLEAHTPAGDFTVQSTYTDGWQTGPLGDLYRPMYFNGGIAVHGAPAIPPYPASHGCCRVSVEAMDMIWSTRAMKIGTRVVVV